MKRCAPVHAGVRSGPISGIGTPGGGMKICVPIAAATNETAFVLMDRALAEADLVEIRLDAIGKPDLKRLLRGRRGRVLVTNRSAAEGGAFDGP